MQQTSLAAQTPPDVSIIVLNYNGADWLPRCVESLGQQTIADRTQIIIADNVSKDGSDLLSQKLLADFPNSLFIQNGCNPGFGAGSNLAVRQATGKYLFFLNPDVWLEPDCVEQLFRGAERAQAGAAGLLVLEYQDDTYWSRGGIGFDFCGNIVVPEPSEVPETLFVAHGFYFIRRELFERVGGYDNKFFLYGEELDLSWRVWAAGEKIIHVPTARIHHRGAAWENPGSGKIVQVRTSDSKRFYANRNHLLTLLKDAHNFLLLLLIPAFVLMSAESLMGALLLRRWSFFSKTCWSALLDCWKLRGYIRQERRRIRSFRQHGDFWMLRFFSWRFARWEDYRAILQRGMPKVEQR